VTLEALESRLRTMLPPEYQDTYQDVQPVSMGSAGLKYDLDGQVAWNHIWATFCDLAMAGGPPHKGTLLEPAAEAEIDAHPDRYGEVVREICRGVSMVTMLPADPSPVPGWVRVECYSEGMAGWLFRAIVMENVAARAEGKMLDLPAGPHYRLDKEIKNVVTVMAKTCHYWLEHMALAQQREITALLAKMAVESPLVEPSNPCRSGWRGVECPSVRAAIWIMRGMVVSNVLSRREGTVLFVPVSPAEPGGDRVETALARVWAYAAERGVL